MLYVFFTLGCNLSERNRSSHFIFVEKERENEYGVAVSGVLEVSMKLELTSPAVMQFRNEAFSASENASLTRVCIVIFVNFPSFNRTAALFDMLVDLWARCPFFPSW